MLSKLLTPKAQKMESSLVRELLHYSQQPDILSLAGGLPDEKYMPSYPAIEALEVSQQYGPSEGEGRLRHQIAEIVKERGVAVEDNQVLVTNGSQQALDLVSRIVLDENSIILTEQPTYLAAIQVFELQGAQIKDVRSDEFGLVPDALRRAIEEYQPKAVYLIPNFQNPAGHCYSKRRRVEIAALLDEKGVLLIEDDPYFDLCYEDVDRTPITHYLETAPWVYMGSFSKVLWPGMRTGYVVSCEALVPYLVKIKQAADLHTNRLGQLMISEYLVSGAYPEHIKKLRRVYAQKRDAMARAIDVNLSGLVSYSLPAGGMFFWVKLPSGVFSDRVLRQALERKVLVLPGLPFFANASELSDGYLRLSFARVSEEDVSNAISILADVIKEIMDESL
ncbi:aminotransferase-like domain-containing protein [Marinomonas mediterranea]|jgi:Transcriptional regulators containing a DNA-binding HTH domain and an aminotransferase domain (MocR family) and their eukaryotic orthologs|uniref:Putative transcriptional regulator, GntR family n=1 Tax=Marinomonas mediterranea (strain ATCC 700492 / JCM 21426 / NBRC 103028 / MMB-1) TaxID=717774 RepID=F2JXB6_MARM1|nr:PLP-dependent aminotransferase family protein [Marinomonas mediterranea]ADZ90722.1 putative transcriptional regulator, GntR family [Marinomonas mediterranea MMB-1]